jgi:hypothetical protein
MWMVPMQQSSEVLLLRPEPLALSQLPLVLLPQIWQLEPLSFLLRYRQIR